MIGLRRHLRTVGHDTTGHGRIVLHFKRRDDTWTQEALSAAHEELHASVAQIHQHRDTTARIAAARVQS